MSAVNPTQNTALIVDEFIKYAQAHLGTVSGIVNMTTLYQAGPATIAAPGLVTWKGYNVESARPTPTQLNEDDFPAKENVDTQNSQLQTNELQNGTTEEDVDKKIEKEKAVMWCNGWKCTEHCIPLLCIYFMNASWSLTRTG